MDQGKERLKKTREEINIHVATRREIVERRERVKQKRGRGKEETVTRKRGVDVLY